MTHSCCWPAQFLDANQPPILTEQALNAGFSLGYLIIIPGILFSGLMIWMDSIAQAWKKRSFGNIATASWNTFAEAHNIYSAMQGMPEAWSSVKDFFFSSDSDSSSDSDDDGKGKLALVVVLAIVVAAILGGIMTTWAIVNHHAGSRNLEPDDDSNTSKWRQKLHEMREQ